METGGGPPNHVRQRGGFLGHLNDVKCAPWSLGNRRLIGKAVTQNRQGRRGEQQGQVRSGPLCFVGQ